MGKPKAPKPPDYTAAAEVQGEASRENTEAQIRANRPTQITPWGSSEWSSTPVYDPASGKSYSEWTQTLNLTPEQQAALDSQMRIQAGRSDIAESMLGRSRDEFAEQMDWGKFQPYGDVPTPQQTGLPTLRSDLDTGSLPELMRGDYSPEQLQRNLSTEGLTDLNPASRYYSDAGDALYQQATSRLDPMFQQREQALDIRLRNQGLQPGDEAYDNAMGNFNRDRTDAYNQAQLSSTLASGQEAQRMLGMDAATRGQMFGERQSQGMFGNQAASEAFAQRMSGGSQRFAESEADRERAFMERATQLGLDNETAATLYSMQDQQNRQQFGQEMQSSQYANMIRQQQIAEEMQRRGFSLNEINAILTGQQVNTPQMPTFNPAARAETPQYLNAAGMQFQSNLDRFSADQAGLNSLYGGIFGMGAQLI